MPNGVFYFARRAHKLRYYGDVIHSFDRKSAVQHDGGVKCVIVYLARDIPPFVIVLRLWRILLIPTYSLLTL